jgi:hypothetical protein
MKPSSIGVRRLVLGLGLIGFIVGKVAATFWAPIFPKYVLLESGDTVRGLAAESSIHRRTSRTVCPWRVQPISAATAS